MNLSIYKLFFYRRSALARDLTAEQLQEVIGQAQEPAERLGVRQLLLAEMRWSNEQFEYFGVEQYPSLETWQEYCRCLDQHSWYQYFEGESYLGLPIDETANELNPPSLPSAEEQPLYRVYLSSLTTYGMELGNSRLNEVWALGRQALREVGGIPLLAGYMRWNNESWDGFGIERFPSHQAVLSYSQYLSVSGWYRVSQARSYLGLAISGLLSGKAG